MNDELKYWIIITIIAISLTMTTFFISTIFSNIAHNLLSTPKGYKIIEDNTPILTDDSNIIINGTKKIVTSDLWVHYYSIWSLLFCSFIIFAILSVLFTCYTVCVFHDSKYS